MSKLERLLNLTAVLLDTTRPLSAEDLRRSVEGYPPPGAAFRRTFERDKDDLRTMGIPLTVERVPGVDPPVDGYRIRPEEYYMADPGLDADELAALHLATLAVRVDGSTEGREALWKLGGIPGESPTGSASVASLPIDAAVTPLFEAIRGRSSVRFTYRGVERTVDPWRLHFQRGRWYVSGFDRVRDAERNFRLARIEGEVEVLTEQPRLHDPSPLREAGRALQGWELGEDEPVMVDVLVDAERTSWMRQEFGPTATERAVEGGTVFTVPVVNQGAFRSFVLGLLEHAEILGPASVRADVVALARGDRRRYRGGRLMAHAANAGERLRRVLAMVPWIVANPGVEVSKVASRFGLTEAEVLEDLNVVWMVGLPPYTPDALVEVSVEDDRVWIHYADFFARPLRLTTGQGLALLASTDGLLSMPGTEVDGPLARALGKLATALGVEPDVDLDVDLGAAEAGHLAALRRAVDAGVEVEIDYYSYGRDERSTRRIAPWRVAATGGAWYVEAYCHLAEGERLFRIDRIEDVRPTGEASAVRPDDSGPDVRVFHPRADDPTVRLRLAPSAAWVAETYPCEAAVRHDDGSSTVTLVVTARPWLERLLLRLGPEVEILDDGPSGPSTPIPADLAARAAARVLERYRR